MRRITALLGGLLLALAALGCAPDATEAEDGRLAAIADATEAAGTARMTMTVTMAVPGFDEGVTATAEGVLDSAAEAFQGTLSVQGGASAETVTGDLIVVDGVQYQRGGFAAAMGMGLDGDRWVRTTGPALPTPATGSPLGLVDQLRTEGEVTEEGTDEVGGVAVRHYRMATTLGALMEVQGGDDLPDDVVAQLESQPEVAQAPVVIDVWADEEDRLRRMRVDTDMSAVFAGFTGDADGGDGDADVRSVVEVELSDFGVEVAISAPPEDEVDDLDMESLAGGDPAPEPGDAEPAEEPEGEAPAVAGAYAVGPALPGARDALAQLPYPLGAERLETSASRIVYAVPAAGDDPVQELLALLVTQAPAQGWTVAGARDAATAEDGTTALAELELTGHGVEVNIDVERDGDEVLVLIRAQ